MADKKEFSPEQREEIEPHTIKLAREVVAANDAMHQAQAEHNETGQRLQAARNKAKDARNTLIEWLS